MFELMRQDGQTARGQLRPVKPELHVGGDAGVRQPKVQGAGRMTVAAGDGDPRAIAPQPFDLPQPLYQISARIVRDVEDRRMHLRPNRREEAKPCDTGKG